MAKPLRAVEGAGGEVERERRRVDRQELPEVEEVRIAAAEPEPPIGQVGVERAPHHGPARTADRARAGHPPGQEVDGHRGRRDDRHRSGADVAGDPDLVAVRRHQITPEHDGPDRQRGGVFHEHHAIETRGLGGPGRIDGEDQPVGGGHGGDGQPYGRQGRRHLEPIDLPGFPCPSQLPSRAGERFRDPQRRNVLGCCVRDTANEETEGEGEGGLPRAVHKRVRGPGG